MSRLFPINALIDKLTEFIKLKGDQLKLEVMGKVAKVLASVITFILLSMVGFMLLFFSAVTMATAINYWLDSHYMGHLIVTGFLLLGFVGLIMVLRTGKLQKWLEDMILSMADDE